MLPKILPYLYLIISIHPHITLQNTEIPPSTTTTESISTEINPSSTFNPITVSGDDGPEYKITTIIPPESTTTKGENVTIIPTKASTPEESSYFCPCDYNLNSCDMNCCCDPDCSNNTKALFSECVDKELFKRYSESANSRKCYKTNFLFRNRTVYKTEISQKGFFCIINDNIKHKDEFPKVNIGRVLNETKPKYFWDLKMMDYEKDKTWKNSYKFGNKILIAKLSVQNDTKFIRSYMSIPSSIFDSTCSAQTPITFLKNVKVTCPYTFTNLLNECERNEILNIETFLKDTWIIGNPSKNLTVENLINFTYLIKSDSTSSWTKVNSLLPPIYNSTTSTCKNILKDLDIVFQHGGTRGIIHGIAHISYTQINSLHPKINQKFSVGFIWENPEEDNIHPHTQRRDSSGNPGYSFGKTILVGKILHGDEILKNKTKEKKEVFEKLISKRKFMIHPSSVQILDVFNPRNCIGDRKPILFGYDLNVNCFFDYTNFTSCQQLQKQIGQILLDVNLQNLTSRYVGSISTPDLTQAQHWIPILTSENMNGFQGNGFKLIDNGCEGIIPSIYFEIVYGRIGSIHFPQLRIHGIMIQFGDLINMQKRISKKDILLSTTVKFTDVTPQPTTPIPQWPIISIKLPSDFFYPFSVSKNESPSLSSPSFNYKLSIFIILILRYFFIF